MQIQPKQNPQVSCSEHALSVVKCSSSGFTILELLIVISILGVLVAVVVPSLMTFRRSSVLNTETQEILTMVNRARTSSMSSRGDLQYGIHFEATRMVLFQGGVYSDVASTNEVHIFDPLLTLGTITINGGGSVVLFQKFTGTTNQNATTTLRVVGSATASSTVIVRPSGVATIN